MRIKSQTARPVRSKQKCACDWDYAQGCPAYLGDEGGVCETLHPIVYVVYPPLEDKPKKN